MQPEAAKLLWDAREAADRIARFIAGRDLEDYLGDDLLRSAVERQFEVVGEALGRLRRIDTQLAERVPDLSRIVDFRNVLAHGYASVDDHLVWDLARTKLPALRAVLGTLLRTEHP